MGWQSRDYAKWTDEERQRFYGTGSSSQLTGSRLFRRGVGPAILASGVLFALGQFPAGHPILPTLHLRLPGPGKGARAGRPAGTINTPSTAPVGTTLTFRGTAPTGNGLVTVEGSYNGGQTWQTLSSVTAANGIYTTQVALTQQGLLQLRIDFADGSRSLGSIQVD